MTAQSWRLPAEWEAQAAVVIAWPHAATDWGPRLSRIETAYTALAAAIARFEPVVLCVADAEVQARASQRLTAAGVAPQRLRWVLAPYDDTWLRDSGPLTLVADGARELLDFRFTGWGGKYGADRDDALVGRLIAAGLFAGGTRHRRIDWALEGGAIESDGRGSLLTTLRCLAQRHPDLSRAQLDRTLCDAFHAERVLWLEHGYLQGDDTDAHIDTLARFAPDDAIVFQSCDDAGDIHHAELARMHAELAALRTPAGHPYRLHALPWPRPIHDGERRLAASYANYLIVNGGVIMPAYADAADAAAQAVVAAAHPGREVVAVDARELIWQNGSVHCLTMQLPAGTLAA